MATLVTRRVLLRTLATVAAASGAGLLLQACGGQAAPSNSTGSASVKPSAGTSASGNLPASAAAPAPAVSAKTGAPQKVRYGEVASGLSLNAAVDQGYFAEQGIELDRQRFDSAANMVAPLGSGQLDLGQGAVSAGLWNAVARGVVLKVVADGGHTDSTPPPAAQQELLVRKDLYDSGKVKTAADLKGMKVGTGIRGTSTDFAVYKMFQKAGLSLNDFEQLPMAPLDLGVAMSNGKVDAAVFIQPAATKMLHDGLAVHLMWDYDAVQNNQAINLLFSAQFAESNLAVPFVTAYLKGVRMYNDAFFKKQTEARNKVIDAAVKYGPEKDRTVYENYTFFFATDPNGKLDLPSMLEQQDFFVQTGAQNTKIDLAKLVDSHYAEQALAKLGPYK